ncbi:MAG: putative lipid II flippase FtsW [Parcubacteria group bacterium]|nr:putative lipid II flippase FtsW [Parcubacteria group bacterium]
MKETSNKAVVTFQITTAVLVLVGIAFLANTSIPISQSNFGESYYYLRHQVIFGLGLGLAVFFVFSRINYLVLRRWALPAVIAVAVLLAAVFLPKIGITSGGARRWLNIAGFTFQPSEIAKLALIIYLAHWLETKKNKITNHGLVLPFLAWVGLVGGLVLLEPDYGTFTLIAVVALAMYFGAGAKIKPILLTALIGGVILLGLMLAEPYRRARVLSFFNPQHDVAGVSYQQNQALIAIGSGGLWGKGLGKGVQKYSYLPETIGDSVFAIISEEFGWLGAVVILGIFLIWILSCLKIAARSRHIFGHHLALGIAAWIGLQTFFNVLGILGLIPFSGIPLPFISYGGTALVTELAAVGIIVNIAKNK